MTWSTQATADHLFILKQKLHGVYMGLLFQPQKVTSHRIIFYTYNFIDEWHTTAYIGMKINNIMHGKEFIAT